MRTFTLLVLLALVIPACAQNQMTVSSTSIPNLSGSNLSSGQVCFLPTTNAGVPISFRAAGGGQVQNRAVCASVVNGAFSIALPNVALTNPANVCLKMTVKDAATGQVVVSGGYNCLQPSPTASWCSGSICNLDNYIPNLAPLTAVTAGPQGPPGIGTDNGCHTDGNGNLSCGTVAASTKIQTADIVSGSTLTAFGDSNTVGFGLTNPTTDGYIYKLAAAKGWTLYNKAVSSSMCADQAPLFMAETPGAGSNYLVNLGYNDMRVSGSVDASKMAQFHGCMMAALSKLGLPQSQFVPGSRAQTTSGQPGCLYTGAWTFPTMLGIVEAYTTAAGATITCVTPPGSTVYLYGLSQAANAGQNMTVTIDGTAMGCNAMENTCLDTSKLTELGTITTVLTASYAPQAWRWAGLDDNYHTVVVTVTGAGAAGTHVLGVAAGNPNTAGVAMPQVIVAEVNRMNPSGYASGAGWPGGGGSDAAVASYNERIHLIKSQLVQDGLQVRSVNLSSTAVLDPYDSTLMQADNVHFTAKGHTQIAAAFANELSGLTFARDRGAGQMLRNVTPYNGGLFVGGIPANSKRGQVGSATGAVTGDVLFGLDGCALRRISSTVYQLAGNCATGITLLQFGGATNQFPAIKVTGGATPLLAVRKADDSGDADFSAGNLTVKTGVAQSGGSKHQRFTLTSTTSSAGNYTDTAVTWTTPFSDANYTVVCVNNGNGVGNLTATLNIFSKNAAGFTIRLQNTTAAVNGGIAECIAMHD